MSLRLPPERVLRVTLPAVITFLGLLVRALLATHRYMELRATSWYRDVEENRRVGGDQESQHLLGFAIDVDGPRDVLDTFLIEARGVGLVAIDEGTHVHVQLLPAGLARDLGFFDALVGVFV